MAARRAGTMVVRRAAFDIGSGSTKLMVADVEVGPPARLTSVLFSREMPVCFALNWKRSADGTLSTEVQEEGLTLRSLLGFCEELGVEESSAVATEVFRKAKNGADYLQRVREELGLSAEIVSQADEGLLGFRTAVALQGADDVLCWDSGGASFQVTSLEPGGNGGAPLRSYLQPLGSGVATAMLVEEIQGKSFATQHSPNPVSPEEAAALVRRLQGNLGASPAWLRGSRVSAIGGRNSMFFLASEILQVKVFTAGDVHRALASTVGATDEELAARHCAGQFRDPPSLICPKLCLLLAVMEFCEIADVRFLEAVGSCEGMLMSPERYPAVP